ncbi:MAG: S8 family serine peptidase [Methylococcaceae bacterium]|nr:S8 family serine peptidase [Methylococcaceae bacterium]
MTTTVKTQQAKALPPAANLIFKSIYMLEDAHKIAEGDGITQFERIFTSPARFEAFAKGEFDKKVDDEASIKESYEKMRPEVQKLHHCFYVIFKSLEMRNAFIQKYQKHDALESVTEDFGVTASVFPIPPNDAAYPQQLWGHEKTNVKQIWNCSRGCGQVVAIVDSGIDITHPDLNHQLWEFYPGIHGVDATVLPPNIGLNIQDTLGHGTHVAGIVAARGNNLYGVIGVAPSAQLMAIKIFSTTLTAPAATAANGIAWAAGIVGVQLLGPVLDVVRADVINCSWGGAYDPVIDYAITAAITEIQRPVIVAPAGDNGLDAANNYPASDLRVICVAATDSTDARATFSNWGSVVDVAAPGAGIYSTVPTTVNSSGFMQWSGTSMAAPYVSAMVAIIRSRLPGLSQDEYKDIVQTYIATITPDHPIGTGRIDFTYLEEILCGCGCSPCRYLVILENRKLLNAKRRKFFTVSGSSNPLACSGLVEGICTPVEIPAFAPCFSLHWGDSPNDQIETHDTEIIYITACNPYCNVSFKGLKIIAIRIIPNYVLPNGEMAVELAASSLICYDTLGPLACATREYALITGSTAPGNYKLEFDYCIEDIELHAYNRGKNSFSLNFVDS